MPRPTASLRTTLVVGLVLVAGFAASAWGGIEFTRHTGGVAAVWTANAFMIAGLIVLPRRARPIFIGLCMALLVTANMAANGDPLVLAGLFTLINVAESWAVAHLLRHICHERMNTPARLLKYIVICLGPACLASSLIAACVVAGLDKGEFLVVLRQWFAASFLGSAVMVPLLLGALRQPWRVSKKGWAAAGEGLLAVGASLFLLVSPIILLRSAGLVLSFPLLTAIAFRRGPRVAGMSAFVLGAIVLPVAAMRTQSESMLNVASFDERVILIQLFVAALFLTTLSTALAVKEQIRTRRAFERRTRMALDLRHAADAASRAKTEFLAAMSHEIRTPMNSMIGFTEVLLRRSDLAEDARRQLTLIGLGGEALLTVVNDILDFSKVEAGQVELNLRPTRLADLVEESAAIVADSARRKGLVLDWAIDAPATAVYLADDHRLRQVLLNLLNNAIKFTPEGSVRLNVTAAPEADGSRVRFAVTDTGIGVAPEALGQLFHRFSQADSSISRTHGGTGLGLAISKGLVELMGGTCGAESKLGQGSTFWFEVPLAESHDAELAQPVEVARDQLAAHVLLVDDHPVNRELGVTVLGLLGCTADVACDGYEAIAMAGKAHYDVILMDVHMPGLDGLQATGAIRGLEGRAGRVPIIAMSADVLPEQLARMREVGMVDSVGKPISIAALNAALDRWVGRDSAGQALAA